MTDNELAAMFSHVDQLEESARLRDRPGYLESALAYRSAC
jgi:hypothetical protein